MKRIMPLAVVGLLSVVGCTKTVYVTTSEAPGITNAPGKLRSGFTVNGYTIERGAKLTDANLAGADLAGADLEGAYLAGADLTGANLYGATMPKGWEGIVAAY